MCLWRVGSLDVVSVLTKPGNQHVCDISNRQLRFSAVVNLFIPQVRISSFRLSEIAQSSLVTAKRSTNLYLQAAELEETISNRTVMIVR